MQRLSKFITVSDMRECRLQINRVTRACGYYRTASYGFFLVCLKKQQAAVDAESTVVLVSELQALTSGDKDVLTGDLQAAVEILSAIGQEGRLESFNETTSALAEKISGVTTLH